jgi:hypothetical protein
MSIILLAWELGGGMGHTARLRKIADALRDAGHTPVMALASVTGAAMPYPTLQSPHYRRSAPQGFLARSYADVLAMHGWHDAQVLGGLVGAWQAMYDLVKPKVVIVDHAPTACLAAYGRLPVVQVGNWFSMPPVDGPEFPALVPQQAPVMEQAQMFEVVRNAQLKRGALYPYVLTGIFTECLSAVECWRFPMFLPELDGYAAHRKEQVYDPLEGVPALSDPKNDEDRFNFMAYLTAENPKSEEFLKAMAQYSRGDVYLRGASREQNSRLRSYCLGTFDGHPAPLEAVLWHKIIVHHGGSLANSALAAGRPQILMPQHLEQVVTAKLVADMGVGAMLTAQAVPADARRALELVSSERGGYAARAAALARLRARSPIRPALAAIVERCAELALT